MNSIPSPLERMTSLPEYHPQVTPSDRLKWFAAKEEENSLATNGPVDLTTMPQSIDYSKLAIDNQDLCETVVGLAKETLTNVPPASFLALGMLTGTPSGAAIGATVAIVADAMQSNPGLPEVTEELSKLACAAAFGTDEAPTNNAVRIVDAAARSAVVPNPDTFSDQPNPDLPVAIDGSPTSSNGESSLGLESADSSTNPYDPSNEFDQHGLGNAGVSDGYDGSDIYDDPGATCEDPGASDMPGWGGSGFPDIDHSDHPSCDADESSMGSSGDDFGPGTSGFDDDYSGGGGVGSGGGASGHFDDRFDESSRVDRDRNGCSGCDGDGDDGGGGG